MKRELFCFRGDCQSEAVVAAKDERMGFLTRTQMGSGRKRNELYYQVIAVSRRKTQIIITWSMVMIATCLVPLRLHQKKPITTFFSPSVIFTWISSCSPCLIASCCTNQFRKKTTSERHLHENMRLFVPHLCSHHCLLDERILWAWNPGLLLFHWGHVNTCIFLIWVPNLCLQAFIISVLKFPTRPPSLATPVFSWLCLCLPPSQFCSSALMEGDVWRAPLRSCIRSESGGGTPGRRRNAILRNICQARRLDEGCSSKAQQEAFVEKGEITPLRPETANWHLCRKVSRLCYANVRALNLVWNKDLVFNYLGQKWF